jgi:two-component system nitrate/nitrite response regulator NarL
MPRDVAATLTVTSPGFSRCKSAIKVLSRSSFCVPLVNRTLPPDHSKLFGETMHDHSQPALTIRVLVADRSPFHTQLLAGALKRDPAFQVHTSDLTSIALAAASTRHHPIDVFVLTGSAEGDAHRGLSILQEHRESTPQARAVMLLDSSNPESILDAFRIGARGVFHIQESSDVLCVCIHRVHEGKAWISYDQLTLVLEALAATPKIRAVNGKGIDLLSKREVQVVRCLAEGLTNREIAQRIGLSQHTVKNYLFRIFDKLGVSNRIELLFMTLSQSSAAPLLGSALRVDPADAYDEETLSSCQKAAEEGIVSAQLALARILSKGRPGDRDLVQACAWLSVAVDQIAHTRNNLKKLMDPAQLAEAERHVRESLAKSLKSGSFHEHKPPGYERTREVPDSSSSASTVR